MRWLLIVFLAAVSWFLYNESEESAANANRLIKHLEKQSQHQLADKDRQIEALKFRLVFGFDAPKADASVEEIRQAAALVKDHIQNLESSLKAVQVAEQRADLKAVGYLRARRDQLATLLALARGTAATRRLY